MQTPVNSDRRQICHSISRKSSIRIASVVSIDRTVTLFNDYESRITSLSGGGQSLSHTYNGLDTRVATTQNSVSRTFKRDGAYVTDQVIGDGAAKYTPSISERRGSTTTFLHSGMKNADAQTNTSGSVSASRVYDAFGAELSSTGSWQGRFGYAGGFGYQEDDGGFKLLGHRYYDPSTGRFLTRDPAKDGKNWYAYCENSPVILVDPTGLAPDQRGGNRGRGDAPLYRETEKGLQDRLKDPNTTNEERKRIIRIQKEKGFRNKKKRSSNIEFHPIGGEPFPSFDPHADYGPSRNDEGVPDTSSSENSGAGYPVLPISVLFDLNINGGFPYVERTEDPIRTTTAAVVASALVIYFTGGAAAPIVARRFAPGVGPLLAR